MPLHSRWQSKPWPGVGIDWKHPLAQGLAGCWVFNEGAGTPVELTGNGTLSASTAFSWASGPDGNVGLFNGATTDLTYTGIPAIGPQISLVCSCMMAVVATSTMFVERETVNGTWEVLAESSSLEWRGSSSSSRCSFDISSIANGQWFNWAFTDNSSGAGTAGTNGYLNGIVQPNTASGGSLLASNTNPIHIGNYDNSNLYLDGQISYIYLFSRVLSAQEVSSLAANPWQVFAPQSVFRLMANPPTAPPVAGTLFRFQPITRSGQRQAILAGAYD